MSLQLHNLGMPGRPMVLGLKWRDAHDQEEAAQTLADNDASAGARIENGTGHIALGLVPKPAAGAPATGRKSVVGLVSAAAWLARSLTAEDVRTIYVHVIQDLGAAWVVSVHKGSVDDRSDVLVGSNDLEDTVYSLGSAASEVGLPYRVVVYGVETSAIAFARWGSVATPGVFADLVNPSLAKQCRIQQLRGPSNAKRVLFWVAFLALIGGALWYDQYRREQKRAAESAPVDSAEVAALRDQRIAQVVSQALIADTMSPRVLALAELCAQRLQVVHRSTGHWTPGRASCDPNQAQIQFQRAGPTSIIATGVAAGEGHGASVQFGPTDNVLAWTWPTSLQSRPAVSGLPAGNTAGLARVLDGLATHNELLRTYYSAVQRSALAWGDFVQVSPPIAKGLQYEDPTAKTQDGAPPVMVPVPGEFSYQLTTITLTTTSLERLRGAIEKADRWWWAVLEKVEANWSARGWRYSLRLRFVTR